ncbi:arrestin domain-containing protein [Colletotrichum asianum]|uniref:Arrestin domain-containing protein n=1 Tax=Colletotrichum asianum TaxID=702518 RepID=A0A8H3WKG8_9PEZI|nr:arrestin domain-containing protein [Colletotrichum asianum]
MKKLTKRISTLTATSSKATIMDINIDNHYTSKVYTCGTTVSGYVSINPRHDTAFSSVQISLQGKASVRIDDTYSSRQTSQILLKVDMPVAESAYPESRTFKAGETYKIPFRFIIPNQLTEAACQHDVESTSIRDYHLRLPSSLTSWHKYDMAPKLLGIRYHIKAKIVRESGPQCPRPSEVLSEAQYEINLLAASPEEPPLSVNTRDSQYRVIESKNVSKALFSGPLGRVTAAAAQPPTIHLSRDGRSACSSSFQANLIFEPSVTSVTPPEVVLQSVKILAQTWYSTKVMNGLPNMGSLREPFNISARVLWETLKYESWKPKTLPDSQDSAEAKEESWDSAPPTPYSTTLRAEFRLPTEKYVFPPTFHSCLISRTYALQISMSAGGTDISLVLPIQIAMEADEPTTARLQDAELPVWRP